MKTLDPTADSASAPESQRRNANREGSFHVWFGLAAFMLGCMAVVSGLNFWSNLFSTVDRVICFAFVSMGLAIALARSNWRGHKTRFRTGFATLLFALTALLICSSVALSNPLWSGIACSTLLAGWCMARIRGDSFWHPLFLGLALLVPLAIEVMANRGLFAWLESTTIATTSLLADAAGQAHATSDQTILFRRGIADHFSTIGKWDSAVSLLGVSFFCILAFRRSLLASCITIGFSCIVWMTVRSGGWVTLSTLANRNETWYAWSYGMECGLFLIGVMLIVSLDQFFANIFHPIPFEHFNPDSPLCAFCWNWLCGLPNLVLRVPAANKIALRWRTHVKLAGKTPSFRTDIDWMLVGLLELLSHPIGVIGSMIDACRGWKWSRSWPRFFLHLPSVILLAAIYVNLGLCLFHRKDSPKELFFDDSLRLCSTKALEIACQQKQEVDFSKAIGAAAIANEDAVPPISDSTMRYIELLSKRFLSIEPNNPMVKYRLGLVLCLSEQNERAEREMREVVQNQLGNFPQANAWLAKAIIINQGVGEKITKQELISHLEMARKWKDADFRLLFLYARLLEEQGDYGKAVEVAKQSISAKPEFSLDLARLYARIGDNEGRLSTANQAEDYFLSRINFPSEKESDRLAVADARLLANRVEQAAEVLSEGLRQNLGGERTVRKLSEIQRLLYVKSVRKNEKEEFEMDLSLLERMVETDPNNPSVSSEIAKLLAYKVKPTKKLIESLKKQIELGITSVPSLLMIGEGYFSVGNLKEAQRFWELAIAKEPDNISGLNNLATCLIAISASNADRAIDLVSKANSLSPNNADILDTLGEALLAANRPKEAVNKLEMAIRIDTNRMDTRNKLITAYEALGMKAMAEAQSKVLRSIEDAQSKATLEKKLIPEEKAR